MRGDSLDHWRGPQNALSFGVAFHLSVCYISAAIWAKRGASMPEQIKRDFWLYAGLVISGLLNLTGMASIVDGLVTRTHFFRDIIDVYRALIREPLAYAGNHLRPFGHIPHWAFDVFVLWSALFLATNIIAYREEGKTILGGIYEDYRNFGLVHTFETAILLTVFLPITLVAVLLGALSEDASEKAEGRRRVRDIFQNFLLILTLFAVILFINWQLKKFA